MSSRLHTHTAAVSLLLLVDFLLTESKQIISDVKVGDVRPKQAESRSQLSIYSNWTAYHTYKVSTEV